MKFAIIVSRFNQSITDNLLQGALKALRQHKLPQQNIRIVQVPGFIG